MTDLRHPYTGRTPGTPVGFDEHDYVVGADQARVYAQDVAGGPIYLRAGGAAGYGVVADVLSGTIVEWAAEVRIPTGQTAAGFIYAPRGGEGKILSVTHLHEAGTPRLVVRDALDALTVLSTPVGAIAAGEWVKVRVSAIVGTTTTNGRIWAEVARLDGTVISVADRLDVNTRTAWLSAAEWGQLTKTGGLEAHVRNARVRDGVFTQEQQPAGYTEPPPPTAARVPEVYVQRAGQWVPGVVYVRSGGAWVPAEPETVTPPDPAPASDPLPVRNLRATSVTSTEVALAWDAPALPEGYTLTLENYRVRVNGAYRHQPSGTTYPVTGLSAGTEYALSVQVYYRDPQGAQVLSSTQAVTVTTTGTVTMPTPTDPEDPPPATSSTVVAFSPPQLTNPITLDITNSDRSIVLDRTRDYIIRCPATLKGDVNINGGRRVQTLGLDIDAPGSVRALYLQHQTESIWLEGYSIRGLDLGEGINGHHATGAQVFLINGRISAVTGTQAGHHADIIQWWAMKSGRTLHVERQEGESDYQGLMWQPDQFGDPDATVRLRKIIWTMFDSGYPIFDGDQATTTWDIAETYIVAEVGKDPYFPESKRPPGITVVQTAPPSVLMGKPGLGYTTPGYGSGMVSL